MKQLVSLFFAGITLPLCAQVTLIPDENFENFLISDGIDSDGIVNGQVLTTDIDGVTSLDVSWQSINTLTGIQDFAALEYLNCIVNMLGYVDVSQNLNLQELHCGGNTIGALDVTQNTQLVVLDFSYNFVDEIDVSQNLLLERIGALGNQLDELDLSVNTLITYISCGENSLEYLNVANGNNINVLTFAATDNPTLFCIEVDDSAYSADNWSGIDPQSYFSVNCSAGTTEVTKNPVEIYPNPCVDFVQIISQHPAAYFMSDINGKCVLSGMLESGINTLNVKDLRHGMYTCIIQHENGQSRHKIVRK